MAVYRGQVQGVGFRYTVLRLAEDFLITGFVRNEWDGSVLLTAEGERCELERFIVSIASSRLNRTIHGVEIHWRPATGAWSHFTVA
ncbi:MAG: acylphosphatase [Kiritimatiellae bacterium]|nr:acylphosphatase [Kiritimatiellia bacterium]MDD4737213.1 acylphosphatase [Kiritimatiellia bacterium]